GFVLITDEPLMGAVKLVQPIVGRSQPKVPVAILEDVYNPPHSCSAPGGWIKRIAGQFGGSSIVDRQASSDGCVIDPEHAEAILEKRKLSPACVCRNMCRHGSCLWIKCVEPLR